MSNSNEELAMRFVELLVERASRNGQTVSRWTNLTPAWRRIFCEAVPEFLNQLGCHISPDGRVEDRREDEQIRVMCDNLSPRQRLKTYKHLYALGCRIDGIERAIERLSKPRT
jgi:hypothetical protein